MPDDLDILPRSMENLQHLLLRHQIEEWLEVDALGQGVDYDRFIRARHLHHAQQGVIGCLTQKFGINSDDAMRAKAFASGGELASCGDQVHERSITLSVRAFGRKR